MKRILSASRSREADNRTMTDLCVAGDVLMERAALAVCECTLDRYGRGCRVLSVCGSGNNGGDGFAAARLLLQQGCRAEVFYAGGSHRRTAACERQMEACRAAGVPETAQPDFDDYDVLIDALLGTGFSGEPDERAAGVIRRMNDSTAGVISVDLPSGVNADTGGAGCAVRACCTVTFSYLKPGHLLFPGRDLCGEVVLRDVGIRDKASPQCLMDETLETLRGGWFSLDAEDLHGLLPQRPERSNKGTFGTAVLLAGTKGMAGAALLCAKGAAAAGCGLVRVISSPENRIILQTGVPEAVYVPFEGAPEALSKGRSPLIAGCGLGTGAEERELLLEAVRLQTSRHLPLLLDADALNILALEGCFPVFEAGNVIITPHPGEMSRISGGPIEEILKHPAETARAFAKAHGVICVLKDACTVITDGESVCLSSRPNSALSRGGSGDVLAGLIGSLLAQGMEAFAAACAGVLLHSLAGETSARAHGKRSASSALLPEAAGAVLHALETES